MILFDLKCGHGHIFEGWFGSSAAYDQQQSAGMIACPVCANTQIAKSVMAPNISAKSNQISRRPSIPQDPPQPSKTSLPLSPENAVALANVSSQMAQMPPGVREILHTLAEQQAKALKTSTYVGQNFAEEARAMYYGEQDDRPIHGEASPQDASDLLDEGIAIMPLLVDGKPRRAQN